MEKLPKLPSDFHFDNPAEVIALVILGLITAGEGIMDKNYSFQKA